MNCLKIIFLFISSMGLLYGSHGLAETSTVPAAYQPYEFSLNPYLSRANRLLRKITQDMDNPYPEHSIWSRVYVSGLFDLDIETHEKKPFINSQYTTDVDLSHLKLNLAVDLDQWVSAHFGWFYATADHEYYADDHKRAGIDLDDAYVLIKNFKRSPIYFKIGEQYASFGRYHRYAIFKALPQSLSELRAPGFMMGVLMPAGFYGSFFIFPGKSNIPHVTRDDLPNYSIAVGVEQHRPSVHVDIGVESIYNMADVGDIRHLLSQQDYYHRRVVGAAFHADVESGPFSYMVRYVEACRHFHPEDFSYQSRSHVEPLGALPRAGLVQTGYTFQVKEKTQKLDVSYEWSREAYDVLSDEETALRLPFDRISMSYGIVLFRNVILEAKVMREQDYSTKQGGTGKDNYGATLRLTTLMI